jgi:hypothetical protein
VLIIAKVCQTNKKRTALDINPVAVPSRAISRTPGPSLVALFSPIIICFFLSSFHLNTLQVDFVYDTRYHWDSMVKHNLKLASERFRTAPRSAPYKFYVITAKTAGAKLTLRRKIGAFSVGSFFLLAFDGRFLLLTMATVLGTANVG